MAFHTKLDMLLTRLHSSNAALARAASLDASLISRFRTGARIPTHNSRQLQNLCQGLLFIAETEQQKDVLANVCTAKTDLSKSALDEALFLWLSADDSILRPERQPTTGIEEKKQKHKKSIPLKVFSEKLDILMNALHVSNTRLARFLNVDASLISRYRNGMRLLSAENQLVADICTYFSTRTNTQQQMADLLDILNIPSNDSPANNPQLLFDRLYQWLTEKQDISDTSVMDNFLEKLDTFHADWNITLIPPESVIVTEGELHTIESFWGTAGIQQAVLRFLTLIAEQTTPRTLYLYSDLQMNWLTSNAAFAQKWASLMLTILSKGNRIKMVHTVNRDFNELFSAIEKWLPLYMTGQIEPYYCKNQKDSRFTHTLFIAAELSSIHSSCITGAEEEAEYILNTDTRNINHLAEQFQSLLASCSSLMQIFTSRTVHQFTLRLTEFERQEGDVKALLSSLSISTMPLDLLTKMLDRAHVPSEAKKNALIYHENRTKRFYRSLSGNRVTEFSTLPAADQPFAGIVCLDLPHFILKTPIYYTPEEYSEHIKNIIQIINQNSQYHFRPLLVHPFKNIQLFVKEGVGTVLIKDDSPTTAFTFSHPLMCSAFSSYVDALSDRSMKIYKGSITETLMKYIL